MCLVMCCCLSPLAHAQDGSVADLSSGPLHGLRHTPETSWSTDLSMLGMQTVIAAWVFVLGVSFGSFLNVVIYRLPAGMSLWKPKSRCPQCETPLAARDNIPVLGWLLLRGRCRYCSLPIAGRYPLIEAVCGVVLLALLFGELLTGAANLPFRHPDHFHVNPGFWLVWFAKWDLSGIYLYHCVLLIVVLATVMIGYDGHRVQKKLLWFGVLTGLIAGTVWPDLRPVAAWPWSQSLRQAAFSVSWTDHIVSPGTSYQTGVSLVGFLDGVCGLAGGLLAGALIRWQMSVRSTTGRSAETSGQESEGSSAVASIAAATLLTGLFLGWQACGTLTFLSLPALAAVRLVTANCQDRWLFRAVAPAFFVLLFVFILNWKRIDAAVWVIGVEGWSFVNQGWRAEWLFTLLVMSVFSSLVKMLPVAAKHSGFPEESTEDASSSR